MRRGVLEQTFLSDIKIGTLGTFEQSPCLLHSYKNITGTLPPKLEHYPQNWNITMRRWICSHVVLKILCVLCSDWLMR